MLFNLKPKTPAQSGGFFYFQFIYTSHAQYKVNPYLAYSITLVSRITVTLISPGYFSSASIFWQNGS